MPAWKDAIIKFVSTLINEIVVGQLYMDDGANTAFQYLV